MKTHPPCPQCFRRSGWRVRVFSPVCRRRERRRQGGGGFQEDFAVSPIFVLGWPPPPRNGTFDLEDEYKRHSQKKAFSARTEEDKKRGKHQHQILILALPPFRSFKTSSSAWSIVVLRLCSIMWKNSFSNQDCSLFLLLDFRLSLVLSILIVFLPRS